MLDRYKTANDALRPSAELVERVKAQLTPEFFNQLAQPERYAALLSDDELDEDMEEERRLFYVAMTRAKTRLHVYAVRERYHKKAEVSRFVWEYLGRDGDSR